MQHLRGQNKSKNISNILKKRRAKHQVSFADEFDKDGKKIEVKEPTDVKVFTMSKPKKEEVSQPLVRAHYIQSYRRYNQMEWYECQQLQEEHIENMVTKQIHALIPDDTDSDHSPKTSTSVPDLLKEDSPI